MMHPRGALEEVTSAYEGLEDSRSFSDRVSLERYRKALLERTAPQADFLLRHIPGGVDMLEIGCGNGRLLVELARRHAISRGLGVDVARSRIAFAQQWAADEACDGLEFIVADAVSYELAHETFGAIVAITGAFGYLEPMGAGTAASVARKTHDALRSGGLVCLELYPHPAYRRLLEASGGTVRVWTELPRDDPWRFYLSELSLDESSDTLIHEKTFVHRTTGRVDAGRRERLHLYREQEVTDVLEAAGFREIRTFEGWSADPYDGGEVLVVTAGK
jgi:SAM-dependent methyltransferase